MDRRIVRSKQALREALIDLMEERGFESLTVNDLCERANLNRGTFYNHYRDKEELLQTFEDEILGHLANFKDEMQTFTIRDLVSYRSGKKPFPFLVEVFDYLHEQGDFLHAAMGPGGDVRFAPRLRDAICTDMILAVLHDRYRNNPTPFVRYYVSFYASAYLGVITRWIDTGMQESSEEMAKIAMRLFFIKPGESITL